jgi:hypothetical protein
LSFSLDSNSLNAISRFTAEMRRHYSQIPSNALSVPLSAGGLNLKAQFLYGDLTEYVAIFTAVGDTSGRSGIHWSNSSCTVLSGEVSRVSDAFNSPVKEKFIQGQNFRHGQFDSYVYMLKDGTTVACYGRGFIPASSIWTISGALGIFIAYFGKLMFNLASGDPYAAGKVLYAYGKLTFDGIMSKIIATGIFQRFM